MDTTVKIGIIGTGVGLRTHLPAFRRVSNAEVISICGSNQARAEEFAKKYNIRWLLGIINPYVT